MGLRREGKKCATIGKVRGGKGKYKKEGVDSEDYKGNNCTSMTRSVT